MLDQPPELAVGPFCPPVQIDGAWHRSSLSDLRCLGGYQAHSHIHPFFTTHDWLVHPSQLHHRDIHTLLTDYPTLSLSEAFVLQPLLDRLHPAQGLDALVWWGLDKGVPSDLKRLQVPTVLVVSDWHYHYTSLLPLLSDFDLICCDEKLRKHLAQHAQLKDKVFYWPAYSYPEEHLPEQTMPHHARDIDVLFAGSDDPFRYSARNQLLYQIAAMPGLHTVLRSDISHQDYFSLLARTKIAFNYGLRGEMNLRAYEATACGALLFMEADNHEVHRFLEPEKAYVPYHHQTLSQQINHYLEHTALRQQIADAGRLAIQQWSYKHQWQRLQTLIREQGPQLRQRLQQRQRLKLSDQTLFLGALTQTALKLSTDVAGLREAVWTDLLALKARYSQVSDASVFIANALVVALTDLGVYPALQSAAFYGERLQPVLQELSTQLRHQSELGEIEVIACYNLAWSYALQQRWSETGYWLQRFYTSTPGAHTRGAFDAHARLFLLPIRGTGFYFHYQQAAYRGDADFRGLLQAGPLFLTGRLCLQKRQYAQAVMAFEGCLERVPDMYEVLAYLAEALLQQNQRQAGLTYLERAARTGVFVPSLWLRYFQQRLLTATGPDLLQLQAQCDVLMTLFQSHKYQRFLAQITDCRRQLSAQVARASGPPDPNAHA